MNGLAALRHPILRMRQRRHDGHHRDLIREGLLSVGRHTFFLPEVLVWRDHEGAPTGGRVEIGAFCMIAERVRVYTGGNHRIDWVSTFAHRVHFGLPGAFRDGHPSSRGDVVIGNDVWIGSGATILSGVRIGHGAVVGAEAVVGSDVRPYAVVAGNPAREIKRRFDDDTVQELLLMAWWDWPDEMIRSKVDILCAPPARPGGWS